MIKNYLLDTNILLQNPQSLFGFEDNNVYLCGTTMQELDSKKTAPGELGYNARECCRILDGLRETGDLTKGVVLHTAAEKVRQALRGAGRRGSGTAPERIQDRRAG